MSTPTPTEFRATLVTLVAGATERHASRWKKLIGEVEVLPIVFDPRCYWRVATSGEAGDHDVIEKAIELLPASVPMRARMEAPAADRRGWPFYHSSARRMVRTRTVSNGSAGLSEPALSSRS